MLSVGSVCGEQGGGLGPGGAGCRCHRPNLPSSQALPQPAGPGRNLSPAVGTLQSGRGTCQACHAHACFPACPHGRASGWVGAVRTAPPLQPRSRLSESDNYNFCKESEGSPLSSPDPVARLPLTGTFTPFAHRGRSPLPAPRQDRAAPTAALGGAAAATAPRSRLAPGTAAFRLPGKCRLCSK